MNKLIHLIKLLLIILFWITCAFSNHLHSQTKDTKLLRNYITTGLAFPFFRTLTFGYERMLNEKGIIRVNISIQSLSKKDSYETKHVMLFFTTDNKQKVFTSNSISVGYGYFILPRTGFYIAGDLSYRYNYFENKYHYDCVGTSSDSKTSFESEYHNDYGLQSIAGFKLVLKKLKQMNFIIDLNGGLGLYLSNQKHVLIAERQGACSSNDLQYFPEPKETYLVTILPSMVLNVNLGINF